MQSFSVRPVFLKHKINSQGIGTIRIAVTIEGKVTYQKTKFRVSCDQWNDTTAEVENRENSQIINIAVRRMVTETEKRILMRTVNNLPITKAVILGIQDAGVSFEKFAIEVREDRKELNRLREFAGKGIMLSDIDVTFLRRYEKHERARGMANNTINTTFKYLRRILNQATAEKLIQENPFDAFEVPRYVQTDRVYLTKPEIDQLLSKAAQLKGSLRVTAYYFLMGCFSGLRHSDWLRFNYTSMVQDGFLKLRAKKNKKYVVLPIGPTLQSILSEVKTLPKPVSNQKCNDMLKSIGEFVGIEKPLTTHAARHSFGYMCASNRIPKSVTAELMGISVQTVEVYYHLSGQNIIDQASVLKEL